MRNFAILHIDFEFCGYHSVLIIRKNQSLPQIKGTPLVILLLLVLVLSFKDCFHYSNICLCLHLKDVIFQIPITIISYPPLRPSAAAARPHQRNRHPQDPSTLSRRCWRWRVPECRMKAVTERMRRLSVPPPPPALPPRTAPPLSARR